MKSITSMPPEGLAVEVRKLVFRYGERLALDKLDLSIPAGQIFALLGPNGSGKSTLFRILASLESNWDGEIGVLDIDLRQHPNRVRQMLGVVFQSPSLDKKLTVRENLTCQGFLYGLGRSLLKSRIDEVTEQLGIRDRLDDRVEVLSGGLKRRVELAKGMLHRPQLLLMDEPSTGLDPASRLDLWAAISQLQQAHRVSVVLTTHLLEEAEKAYEIGILDSGKCVASGSPEALRRELGSQVLTVQSQSPQPVLEWLKDRRMAPQWNGQSIRVAGSDVAELVAPLCSAFPEQIGTVAVGRPGLEDVFIARTGHHFWNEKRSTPS